MIEMKKKYVTFFFFLKFHEYGVFQLNKTAFSLLNLNLKVEILKKLLVTSSGKIYPPRYKCTVNLIKKISSGKLFKFTLHGNIIVVKNEKIFFYREIRKSLNNKVIIPKGSLFLWDDRFLLSSENIS